MNATPHEETLFQAALPLAAAERAAFLDRECAGNPALRSRLEALLAAHDQPDTVFGTGTHGVRPTIELDLADDLVGQTIGRYKLLEKIGEGGCGVVYVAEQTEPMRRRVALKIIKLGMDTKQVVARFEAERQALAMMDHPNIAKVLDAGTTEGRKFEVRSPKSEVKGEGRTPKPEVRAGGSEAQVSNFELPSDFALRTSDFSLPTGRPYFVMELVRGIKITDYCDQEQLSTRDRLDLFIKVCHAIQHAHQKGIIHRDIKPSNILVTLHDGVPVPKVIDFGIAKAVEGRLTDATVYTQLHQFIGTPAYMSPEQAEMSPAGAGDIDTRSDIYSLGVLLYELLTGTTPFDAKKLMSQGIDAMRRTIREEEPVRPSTRLTQLRQQEQSQSPIANRQGQTARAKSEIRNPKSEIETDLDWIVMKCLEKERTRRYDNATSLAQDIQRHLDNQPIQARPITTAARVRKWIKRKPATAALVGMGGLTVLALVGAAVTQLALQTERRLRTEIEQLRQQETGLRAREAESRQAAEAALAEAERANYFRNITSAQRDWQQNNVGRADQLLDECAPQLRRWEWGYLKGLCHADLLTVVHDSAVRCVAFSPDGQSLASGTADGKIRLTSVGAGEEVFTVSLGVGGVNGLAFAPDGSRLVAAVETNLVVLDAVTGAPMRTIAAHASTVETVAWSGDGTRLASGSRDCTAKIWNADTGELALELPGQRSWVQSVVFSPDSKWLVTASGTLERVDRNRLFGHQPGEVVVWNVHTGEEIRRLGGLSRVQLRAELEGVFLSMAFDPQGLFVAAGTADGKLGMWNATDGQSVNTFPKSDLNRVLGLAFLPLGRVVSAGADTTVRVWSIKTGAVLSRYRGHTKAVNAVATSPDGRFVASASENRTVKLWNADGNPECSVIEAAGVAVRWSQNGRLLAVVGERGCEVWDQETKRSVHKEGGHESDTVLGSYRPRGLAFSPHGGRLAASLGTNVLVWSTRDWKLLHRLEGVDGTRYSIAYSPDGRWVATGSGPFTGKVIIWDAETGQEVRRLQGNSNAVWSVVFSPDGRRLAVASGGYSYSADLDPPEPEHQRSKFRREILQPGEITIWDADSGEVLHTLRGHRHCIWDLAFSPDGQILAAASCHWQYFGQAEVKLWSPNSGTEIASLPLEGTVALSVSFSPDGTRLAVGTGARGRERRPSVDLWDWRSGREVLSLGGHEAEIISVAFSPDGNSLASCSGDGTVRIFDASERTEQSKRRQRLALLRE